LKYRCTLVGEILAFGCYGADAPVRGAIGRFGMQRGVDQLGDALVVDRARLARKQLVVQTADARFEEAAPPLAHRGVGQLHALGDLVAGVAFRRSQHDARCITIAAASGGGRAIEVIWACSASLSASSAFGRPIGNGTEH
jgi:hypothetical protein